MTGETGTDLGYLNAPLNSFPQPEVLPAGIYLFQISRPKGAPLIDKSPNKGTPFSEFTFKPISIISTSDPNFDESKLSRAIPLRQTYWLGPDDVSKLRYLASAAGMDETRSPTDILGALEGATVRGTVEYKANKNDRTRSHPEIVRVDSASG